MLAERFEQLDPPPASVISSPVPETKVANLIPVCKQSAGHWPVPLLKCPLIHRKFRLLTDAYFCGSRRSFS